MPPGPGARANLFGAWAARPGVLFRHLDTGEGSPEVAEARRDLVQVLTEAIRGSDAYAAVRRAVRVEEGVLRVGNGLVRRAKVREVGFLAVGHCAAAMARGFHDALGEVVTQGLVAGPEPPPEPWPFLFRKVDDDLGPSQASVALAAEALELAGGLGEKDLLVPLLSPGALGMLASPPSGMGLQEYRHLWETVRRSPRAREDLPAVAAALSPAQGGRLASAARGAHVESLVVARGEGGIPLGGGPTVALSAEAVHRAREALERTGGFEELPREVQQGLRSPSLPAALSPERVHTVVIASPADALESAGAEAAGRKYRARLADLNDPSPPEAAADHLLAAFEERAPRTSGAGQDGIAVFSGLSLGVPEAGEDAELLSKFLTRAHAGIRRRGLSVAVLSTVGSVRPGATPSGGFVEAQTPFSPGRFEPGAPHVLDLAPGFTDVGAIAVAFWTPPVGKPSRR